MSRRLVRLAAVAHEIPASLSTIYCYRRGIWSDWITRFDDAGHRGRELLVDRDAAQRFWAAAGRPCVGERIELAADQHQRKVGGR